MCAGEGIASESYLVLRGRVVEEVVFTQLAKPENVFYNGCSLLRPEGSGGGLDKHEARLLVDEVSELRNSNRTVQEAIIPALRTVHWLSRRTSIP
jgi:hypothetical protein